MRQIIMLRVPVGQDDLAHFKSVTDVIGLVLFKFGPIPQVADPVRSEDHRTGLLPNGASLTSPLYRSSYAHTIRKFDIKEYRG